MREKERKRFTVANCDTTLDALVVWHSMCVWCNCYSSKLDLN